MSTSSRSRVDGPPNLRLADAICISVLVVVLLVLSYLRSRHCVFWSDEIMGWIVLKQPTLSDTLRLWRAGLDSSGLWFYVFGRPWTHLFGASEVSLRLYSAAGVAVAAALTWAAARRFYSILPVAASVAFVFASNDVLRWQLANGRTYGWFMFSSALVIYLIARGEEEEKRRPGKLFLLATVLAYSALAGSHILGVVYVCTFLTAQAAIDVLKRRPRPLLYLSAACSLAVVWFSRANLVATAALGKPHFWTQRPTVRNLVTLHASMSGPARWTVWLLVLIGLFFLRFQGLSFQRRRLPVYCLLVVFGLLDLALFLYSRVGTSIYVDRYLLPFNLIGIFLLCESFTQIAEARAAYVGLRLSLPWLWVVASVGYFFVPSLLPEFLPLPDRRAGLMALIPNGLPVIDVDAESFVGLEFYGHPKLPTLIYPADREIAVDPTNRAGASGFNEMQNWKSNGIYAKDVQPTSEILSSNRTFMVISSKGEMIWLQRRILSNPTLSGTLLATDGDLEIWMVHRIEAP